nr:protein STRUBBELIG-receptor family 6 [Tanacetum cinerariifolium]
MYKVEALLGARDEMLKIRFHMRQMDEAGEDKGEHVDSDDVRRGMGMLHGKYMVSISSWKWRIIYIIIVKQLMYKVEALMGARDEMLKIRFHMRQMGDAASITMKLLKIRVNTSSFVGAMVIADLVKTALGTKGMDESITVFGWWATPQLHDMGTLAKMVDPAELEFRPPMSKVVQAFVKLVYRANISKRIVSIEQGYKMAANSAQSALLERIKDNKEDASSKVGLFKQDLHVLLYPFTELDYIPATIMVLEEGRTKCYIEQNMYSHVYDDC